MTAVALSSDLMGLGMAPALAGLVGDQIATLAGVGTAQSGAAAISTSIVNATTSSGQTAFVLPASQALANGILVANTSATTALVFPPTGGTIDGGAANASVNVAQNKARLFVRVSATAWVTLAGA